MHSLHMLMGPSFNYGRITSRLWCDMQLRHSPKSWKRKYKNGASLLSSLHSQFGVLGIQDGNSPGDRKYM